MQCLIRVRMCQVKGGLTSRLMLEVRLDESLCEAFLAWDGAGDA